MKKNQCEIRNQQKCTSRSTHITHKIFGKNCAAIHEIKPVLKLNKPMLDLLFQN